MILCDPAPRTVWLNKRRVDLSIKPFEGGFHGFIPDEILGLRSEKPLHESFFDDLSYYSRNHIDVLGPLGDPVSAAIFPRKLVASHYCQLLGFVSHQTASMRSSGWAAQRRTQREIDESNQVETAWSQFKCPEYLEALGAVLDSLGIPQGHEPYDAFDAVSTAEAAPTDGTPDIPSGDGDWLSSTPDFLYLHREFRAHLADYARMTSSLAALNGMIGGRIAILEARTAKSLTLVASKQLSDTMLAPLGRSICHKCGLIHCLNQSLLLGCNFRDRHREYGGLLRPIFTNFFLSALMANPKCCSGICTARMRGFYIQYTVRYFRHSWPEVLVVLGSCHSLDYTCVPCDVPGA